MTFTEACREIKDCIRRLKANGFDVSIYLYEDGVASLEIKDKVGCQSTDILVAEREGGDSNGQRNEL